MFIIEYDEILYLKSLNQEANGEKYPVWTMSVKNIKDNCKFMTKELADEKIKLLVSYLNGNNCNIEPLKIIEI